MIVLERVMLVAIYALMVVQLNIVWNHKQSVTADLENVSQNSQELIESNRDNSEQQEKIKELIKVFAEEEKLAQEEKLAALTIELDLHKAMYIVTEAERLRLQKKLPEASEEINKAKEFIWKSGDAIEELKEDLQGLMYPIDQSVEAWADGNAKFSNYSLLSSTVKNAMEKSNEE